MVEALLEMANTKELGKNFGSFYKINFQIIGTKFGKNCGKN